MFTVILRTVFLLFFLVIVSQGIFYLFSLSKALSGITINSYAEIRNSTDQVIEWRLKFVYPAALVIGIVATLFLLKTPQSLIFITTAIALLCLLVDLVIAIKFNMPINDQFHNYTAGVQEINWELLRRRWLYFLEIRGVVQVFGFLSLLVGFIKN